MATKVDANDRRLGVAKGIAHGFLGDAEEMHHNIFIHDDEILLPVHLATYTAAFLHISSGLSKGLSQANHIKSCREKAPGDTAGLRQGVIHHVGNLAGMVGFF